MFLNVFQFLVVVSDVFVVFCFVECVVISIFSCLDFFHFFSFLCVWFLFFMS